MTSLRYMAVQKIAKDVHSQLAPLITSISTEQNIVNKACHLLAQAGAPETWYHNVPAFVLLGSRSCLSISGREYIPETEPVGDYNLVTVDLSPILGGAWGDCARSYPIEQGQYARTPVSLEFREGLTTQEKLHTAMKSFATPETRFCELYRFGNEMINQLGYENLDFLNNLGHSIETSPDNRRFIDKDCHAQLGDVAFFTFEPHIRKSGERWGFKHENIYYFDDLGNVIEL